jgi:ABC-type transport system involved in Fe-S cluster assembly fused permease/ATPase subunit
MERLRCPDLVAALTAEDDGMTSLELARPSRSAAISCADPDARVVLFDHGRIIERGTHAELLAHGGWYARTALAQATSAAP